MNAFIPAAPSWERLFQRFLRRACGNDGGPAFAACYAAACPPGYREQTPPVLAGRDALRLRRLAESGEDAAELWRDGPRHLLRLYSRRGRFLDELLPLLACLGLRVAEHAQFALPAAGGALLVASFSVRPARPDALPLLGVRGILLEALRELLAGRLECDGLNGLLPLAGLAAREIDVFRAYRNYGLQLGRRFGRESFQQALLNNPPLARLLFGYFEARFDPAGGAGEEALDGLRLAIAQALDAVADAAEDRILRGLFNLLDATLRTNYYRRRDFLAFKVASLGVLDMPAPCPLYEIYVHAVHMEGIHLRGAKVARGGVRWSDRPDDFRAEILRLQQTQAIKNAQIVPQGAKGGFVVKGPNPGRAEADAAYGTLVRGLLDLTDNLAGAGPVRPAGVLAYDDADPYLVVAADKGTAHLSDAANALAAEYGFWLGDAFASGGSRGYDHKRLGITARGAWECVKRHFREAGLDVGRPFTVVGVGSMDGDVFGNGMLLSPSIRLKAAFGARHIFLDPEPGGEASLRERRRLFGLPGSSWDDYDRRLISPGGGVFARAAKDIPLAGPVREWLGTPFRSIDGEGLARLLLAAPVDLLWLGGVGTYVKAGAETHEQVGDRANDAARADARGLRAKVVGEGANLGFTQRGRVEFALAGGRINNDALDNSAGVDLSDREVNLKILLAGLVREGLVAAGAGRDAWLEGAREEVCRQVLADNNRQSLCLSLDAERCRREAEPFLEVAGRLENAGRLDRAGDAFPADGEVLARPGRCLARPELAVLMPRCKLALKEALLESPGFLDSPCLAPRLAAYFPAALRERFGGRLAGHPLAREITATVVVNAVINQAGCGFLGWAFDLDAGELAEAVRAYLGFDEVVGGQAVRDAVQAAEESLPAARQHGILLGLEDLLADCCRWALASGRAPGPESVPAWRAYWRQYLGLLGEEPGALGEAGEPAWVARAGRLGDFPVLAQLAECADAPLPAAAGAYRAVAGCLGLEAVPALLAAVPVRDAWERRLRAQLGGRFRLNLARLGHALLVSGQDAEAYFDRPGAGRRLERLRHALRELHPAAASLPPYAVLAGEFDGLAEHCLAPAGSLPR